MNREEWLSHLVDTIKADRTLGTWVRNYNSVNALASFPARPGRKPKVGDLVRDADGTDVLLVSPLISSSLEVAVVTYWLMVRRAYRLRDTRQCTTQRGSAALSMAGFNRPFDRCVPTERLLDAIGPLVETLVDAYGEYPSAEVNVATRPTQSTRLLKVMCDGNAFPHDDYILRMSQAQYDRGAPGCGVCSALMTLA
jgi:hypothetical protein